jgi:hypothetical protein
MLKLLMKKLGTPENDDALSVEGSGGVNADGVTAFVTAGAWAARRAAGAFACEGTTVARGWERCVRTSGAGAGAVSVVVVVVVVVVGVDVVVVVVGAGAVFGFGVVLGVVVDDVGSEGAGSEGGAGTVVVPVEDPAVSVELTLAVASAPHASTNAVSATRSGGNNAVRARRIMVSCQAGS